MKRRIVVIVVIFVIIFGITINAIANTEDDLNKKNEEITKKIEEANHQLEYVQDELTTALQQIQKLNVSIEQYEKEAEELRQQLKELEQSTEDVTTTLEEVEKRYKKQDQLLKERMVALYEAGDTSYLDVLLQSKGITDFIASYYTLTQIAELDTELLNSIEQDKKQIEQDKLKLDQKRAQVRILKAKSEQNSIVLQNTRTVQQSHMNLLSEEEKEIQNKIDEYKAEQVNLQQLIQQAIENATSYDFEYTGGKMIWPIAKSGTYVTSPFGQREHPIQGIVKLHTGMDIGNAGFGAPVIAAMDGIVTHAGWLGSYGNCVMINHGNGIISLYAHGQQVLTSVGTVVKQGDLIMEVGSTGNSTGPHLHFEVRENGKQVNPEKYLKAEE